MVRAAEARRRGVNVFIFERGANFRGEANVEVMAAISRPDATL